MTQPTRTTTRNPRRKPIQVWFPDYEHAMLDEVARGKDTSVSEFVRRAVRHAVAEVLREKGNG